MLCTEVCSVAQEKLIQLLAKFNCRKLLLGTYCYSYPEQINDFTNAHHGVYIDADIVNGIRCETMKRFAQNQMILLNMIKKKIEIVKSERAWSL